MWLMYPMHWAWFDQCFSVTDGIRISTALATPLDPFFPHVFFAILKFTDTTSMLVSSNILSPLVQSLIPYDLSRYLSHLSSIPLTCLILGRGLQNVVKLSLFKACKFGFGEDLLASKVVGMFYQRCHEIISEYTQYRSVVKIYLLRPS